MLKWTFMNFIVIIFNFVLLLIKTHRKCGGPKLNTKIKKNFYSENIKRNLQTANWSSIRIYTDFTFLESETTVDPLIITSIKTIVNQTVAMFTKVIKVIPLSYNITIQINDCNGEIIPSKILQTSGVAADIVIFPYIDLNQPKDVEAYASCCIQDSATGRPVAGFMAFTQNLILNENWLEYNTYTCFHEITHIFLFDSSIWKDFIDSTGNPIPINQTVKNVIVNDLPRTKIITPKVIAAAKKHFNCESVDGVELENQGGDATAGNHWDARIMLTDYMMGQSYDEVAISDITFAFFEDSGWYQMNYFSGGLFKFGKNEGCNYLNSKCIINSNSQFPKEYCDKNGKTSCSNGRISKGVCYIPNYDSSVINSSYRYFGNLQGGYQLADFCPVSQAFNLDGVHLPYSCIFGIKSQFPPELEERISDLSACFVSSLVNNNKTSIVSDYIGKIKSICYSYICNSSNKTITVLIGNNYAICDTNGGTASINGYSGILYCPDYYSICTGVSRCRSIIECIMNQVKTDPNSLSYSSLVNYVIPNGTSAFGSASGSVRSIFSITKCTTFFLIILLFIY